MFLRPGTKTSKSPRETGEGETPEVGASDGKSAGDAFSDFITEQLTEERASKTSLESRGISVITSSSALITLLLGVATLAAKLDQNKAIPTASSILMIVGLGAFLVAGAAGALSNAPGRYGEADPDSLATLLSRECWLSDRVDAEISTAMARLEILDDARTRNSRKAICLLVGFIAEVVSVVAFGCAISLILV